MLIDFEFSAYSYRAYDIANHFLEHMFEYTSEPPYFKINPDAYPSRTQQVCLVKEQPTSDFSHFGMVLFSGSFS